MHTEHVAHGHSVWADLDALVLEEVDALAEPKEVAEPQKFGSEDEFVADAVHYLRQRTDPEQLIERLRQELGLQPGDSGDGLGDMDAAPPAVDATAPEGGASAAPPSDSLGP